MSKEERKEITTLADDLGLLDAYIKGLIASPRSYKEVWRILMDEFDKKYANA